MTAPAGWTRANLGDIATWGSGGTPSAGNTAFYNGDIPWAVIGDLTEGMVTETKASISEAGLSGSSAKIVPAGAVLIAMYGASIGRLGIAARPMATNQAIAHALTTDRLNPKFLFYYLMSQKRGFVAAGKGAAQPNIGQAILKAWPISYPEDSVEQQRIVDILEEHLSRLDAAAKSVAAANRRLIAMHRSALNTLFSATGNARVPLRELVIGIEAGRSFGGSTHPAADDGWGIIKVSAMTWGEFRASENKAIASDRVDIRHEISKGDLLLSRANTLAYVGASVLVGEVRPRLLLSDKSLRILVASEVDSQWLWRALSSPDARSQMSAAATGTKDSMRNISQTALLNIELSAVPVPEQRVAVARSREVESAIDRLAVDLKSAAVQGERLRLALLGAAFSGRLTGQASAMEMVEEMASV